MSILGDVGAVGGWSLGAQKRGGASSSGWQHDTMLGYPMVIFNLHSDFQCRLVIQLKFFFAAFWTILRSRSDLALCAPDLPTGLQHPISHRPPLQPSPLSRFDHELLPFLHSPRDSSPCTIHVISSPSHPSIFPSHAHTHPLLNHRPQLPLSTPILFFSSTLTTLSLNH
jgi:hypothetical protein